MPVSVSTQRRPGRRRSPGGSDAYFLLLVPVVVAVTGYLAVVVVGRRLARLLAAAFSYLPAFNWLKRTFNRSGHVTQLRLDANLMAANCPTAGACVPSSYAILRWQVCVFTPPFLPLDQLCI